MKKTLLLWLFGLLLTAQVFAQNRTLSGTVKDAATGEALIGVNVTGKGTTIGTVTDIDGKYTLELPKEVTTLVFSYIGYTNVEKPILTLKIDANLSAEGLELEEVVIGALGIKKEEKAVTYSSQKLDGQELTKAREANLVNQLSGKIAGVQVTSSSGAPGASSRLIIRGASSLTGSNQPLYVVDGIPIDNRSFSAASNNGGFDGPNGINSVNADDIEDIQVLKGSAASALYGVRAANGVVLITTKKGKVNDKRPVGVEINTSLEFQSPFILPDFQNSYGQGVSPDFFDWGSEGDLDGAVDESWGPALDKGLEFVQWNSYANGGKPLPWVSKPNNVRDMYNLGVTWNNSIALSGATDKATFRLSFGNLNQKGMVYNTDYNRYTVGLNASYKLVENLTASFSATYTKEKSNNLPTMGYASENIVQQTIWSGRNVDFKALRDWRNLPIVQDPTRPAYNTPYNWNTQFQNNPFWVLDNNLNTYNKDRLIGNFQLNYKIHKYVSLNVRSGADYYSYLTTERKAIYTNESRDGFYREIHRKFNEINTDALLSYNQSFLKGDKLSLSLNVGGNLMQSRFRNIIGTVNALELPNLYTLSNVKSGQTAQLTNTIIESNLNTIRSFGELSWDRWVYVNFTLTNDWASVLPKDNNKFLSYSVGSSLVLSELIKKQQDVLSFLKVRGSYASVGNFGALDPYRIQQNYAIRPLGATYGNIFIYDPASLNNPNLKPERTNEWEVGIDARLYKNMFRISATYYDKKSKDLLLPVPVSATTGYTTAWQNIGSVRNRGVELQFGATLVDKKDYKLDIDFNWAKNENKVIDIDGSPDGTLILGGHWDMTLEAVTGQPYGVIRGKGFLRNDEGQIIYQNGLPVVDETKKSFGTIQPKWTGGMGLSLNIKGVTISTLFDMKWGGYVHSMTYTWGRYAGTLAETLFGRESGIVGDGVVNVGTEDEPVYVPNTIVVSAKKYNQSVYSNNTTENAVFDASYIKWRRLYVGYTLPAKVFKNVKVQEVSFGVVGSNLMMLFRRAPHIDPETGFSDANEEQGQEFGQLPAARSIGFNFNIKF
jgi:TonB-linked SusC/RagA family outer membrane protein